MSTITFDTLKFVETLKDSGMDEKIAKGIAIAYRDASNEQELVTKKDLQIELAPIKQDISLMKWMLGLVLGGIITIMVKLFLPMV